MKRIFVLAIAAIALLPALAMAADGPPATPATTGQGNWYFFPPGRATMALGITVGLGLIIIGAGRGIGSIGTHATDAIARQPEAGGRIFTSMIISAALIEGVTLFSIVVALLTMILGTTQ